MGRLISIDLGCGDLGCIPCAPAERHDNWGLLCGFLALMGGRRSPYNRHYTYLLAIGMIKDLYKEKC